MKLGRTAFFGALAMTSVCLPVGSQAWASDQGSMEDQMACTPDVYRLCSSHVPDEDAIVACLQQNVQNLSPACHKVFTRPPSQGDNNSDSDD